MMGKEYAMSCHDIGHGMNAVSKTVLDLYESGQISRESIMVPRIRTTSSQNIVNVV